MQVYLPLFLLLTLPLPAQKKPDPCAMSNLPSGVQDLVKSRFPDLRPKRFSDLGEDDQKLWSTSSNSHYCPGIAIGSFEEPSQREYAILLIPKAGPENRYIVVVLAPSKSSTKYHASSLDHGASTPNSGLVISRVPPGNQEGFDESKAVKLELDGINVEWLEKSSVLYYYSNGRYHHLQTSD